ncbi:MAG: NAD(P)/FAD-dependent oxidoreductase [Acidobacteriota bacterium]|nr:NAD(P)/FAD-dependent oxidoreductase [Acidobacteriota bacterium]
MQKEKVAIVGSGFLGLTLALRLAETGAKVTVFESASEIGGLAGAWQIGDVVWDKHYHVTLLSDSYTRKIVSELGLENEFNWVETKTGFYTGGRLVSMSNAVEFLKFPPLNLTGKFRLGATIFCASRVKDWKRLEKIPVEEWLTRLSGRRTFEKIWKPLLKAKLGEAYRETSAAFIWATIQRLYAARNSGLKKEMFGYVRGGYARVLERFGEVLREKGVRIHLNSRVEKIEKLEDGKVRIFAARRTEKFREKIKINSLQNLSEISVLAAPPVADDSAFEFDSVILTCPASVAAKICPQLTESEKTKLENVKYQGIVCASLLSKNSLSDFYVTNITDETPFTGIIEMSALADKREFGGNALVYLPKYVAPTDELFEKSDAEIEEIFLTALEKMYAHFQRKDVLAFKVSRVRQVFPIPTLNYSENLPPAKTSLENVFVINSAHIVNGTLNVNETVQLAEKFFEENFKRDG